MPEDPSVQGELFPEPSVPAEMGAIEAAAGRTIDAMREYGAIDATHDLKIELIRTGSRALDREFRRDKVTVAATTLFSRVVDIADALPTVQVVVDSKFNELTDALADAE